MTQYHDLNHAPAKGPTVLDAWRSQRDGWAERAGVMLRNDTTVLSNDPRVVEFFGAQTSASGLAVTATSALRVSTVYRCVALIAGAIGSMPLHIYERTWDEATRSYQRRRVDDADLWWLLNESPAAAWTSIAHWERSTEHVLLRGDTFTELRRNAVGRIKEMVPHAWADVTVSKRDDGRLLYVISDGVGKPRGVDQDDVLHFANFGFDGQRAPSVISRAAMQAVGNALAMDEYSGRFFAGGAHPSIVLQAEGKLTTSAIDALQRTFSEKYSGLPNAFTRPLVLTEGVKANPITISAHDAQLLEARKFQVIDICRAFGVPPHMVGETSASTSWGSGIESMGRGFVTYTLQPRLVAMEQELNRKLFRTARYFVEFDRSALIAGDSKAQAEADKSALGGPGAGPGYESVDEIRRRRNLPPLGGRYAVPYWPETKGTEPASNQTTDPAPAEEDAQT